MRDIIPAIFLAALLPCGGAWAYGGGGGSTSCVEPSFTEPSPVGPVASLSEFSFTASDNTDINSLSFELNADKIKPAITQRRSGDYEVKVALPQPITAPGKVRVAANAQSKGGCAGALIRFIEVKP